MASQSPPEHADAEAAAQRSADRLALALEDVGFDVGRAFPALHGAVDRDGAPVVDLGRVSAAIATSLAALLAQAAQQDITV